MRTDNLGNVVAEGEGRIGVQRAIWNIAGIFGEAVLAAIQTNAGNFAAKTVVVDSDLGKTCGALPRPNQAGGDVVGGVAGNEFVQQRRRRRSGDSRNHADARAVEVGLNRGKGNPVGPEGNGIVLVPRIVNVTKSGTDFVADVVVDAEKFFPPVSGQ